MDDRDIVPGGECPGRLRLCTERRAAGQGGRCLVWAGLAHSFPSRAHCWWVGAMQQPLTSYAGSWGLEVASAAAYYRALANLRHPIELALQAWTLCGARQPGGAAGAAASGLCTLCGGWGEPLSQLCVCMAEKKPGLAGWPDEKRGSGLSVLIVQGLSTALAGACHAEATRGLPAVVAAGVGGGVAAPQWGDLGLQRRLAGLCHRPGAACAKPLRAGPCSLAHKPAVCHLCSKGSMHKRWSRRCQLSCASRSSSSLTAVRSSQPPRPHTAGPVPWRRPGVRAAAGPRGRLRRELAAPAGAARRARAPAQAAAQRAPGAAGAQVWPRHPSAHLQVRLLPREEAEDLGSRASTLCTE